MKRCEHCGRLNDDGARRCHICGKQAANRSKRVPPRICDVSKNLTPEIEDTGDCMLTIRCRTPEEAYLIMEQLACSNIIVVSPGRATMNKACQSRGYVGLKVSAQ